MSNLAFSSIQKLLNQGIYSFKRFPLVMLSAIVVAIVGCQMVNTTSDEYNHLFKFILCGALGVPLFFAIKMFWETTVQNNLYLIISYIIGLLFLTFIFFSLPQNNDSFNTSFPYIRYILFSICIHLALSFAPYLSKGKNNGFWQFNNMLFVRLWISILYCIVLYIGITGALLAIKGLFDISIEVEVFGKLWIIISSVINIWIFISGINPNIKELDNDISYPNSLKIFAQYILVSLVTLYLLILYTYIGKIIVTWDWPKGIISYLIIGVSSLGYLTTLLLHPYQKLDKNIWIRNLTTTFHILVLPLCLVLFLAVSMRISDYGVTLNRYFILILGVWLWCTSLIRIWKKDNIKVIPISLAALSLLTSFGFWGARAVSERSQVNRLKNYLIEAKLLVNNKLVQEHNTDGDILYKDSEIINLEQNLKQDIRSITKYLDDYHRFEAIQPWFTQNLDSLNTGSYNRYFNESHAINIILFGKNDAENTITSAIMSASTEAAEEVTDSKHFSYNKTDLIKTQGYNYLLRKEKDNWEKSSFEMITIDKKDYILDLNVNKLTLTIENEKHDSLTISFKENMETMYDNSPNSTRFNNNQKLYFETNNEKLKLGIQFDKIQLKTKNDKLIIKSYEALIFIEKK